jgi:hypothetical protein
VSARVEIAADIVGNVRAVDIGVFVVLRDHLNHSTGLCNPSLARVARLAEISHDSAQRSIERLEAGGFLAVHRTKGECNSYRFPQPHAKTGVVTTRKNGGGYTQDHTQNWARNKEQPKTLTKDQSQNLPGSDVPGDVACVDIRHAPIRELIKKYHREVFNVACEWDGSEAKALDKLLRTNPTWTVEQISSMVWNRFASEITGERPRRYLANLGDYIATPLDRYGKPWRDTRPSEGLGSYVA